MFNGEIAPIIDVQKVFNGLLVAGLVDITSLESGLAESTKVAHTGCPRNSTLTQGKQVLTFTQRHEQECSHHPQMQRRMFTAAFFLRTGTYTNIHKR